jgi:hypothetical protein
MVNGLDVFRNYFRDYINRYILIGGTACDLAMEEANLPFRATKDLDIVLCIEVLDREFVEAFWDFIRIGGYQVQEKASGKKQFYHFTKPADKTFPYMLELFSRKPDALSIADESNLTPIPTEQEVASLSAILLDDGYYSFITQGKRESDGLPFIGADRLIPLKARAWLDLNHRRQQGETVDSKNIRKHKNDVFRLYQIVEPGNLVSLPTSIAKDLRLFFNLISTEAIDLKSLGLGSTNIESIITELKRMYGLD